MTGQRRKANMLIPQCHSLECRLALSGNFLTHGYADVVREVNQIEHHHHADHSNVRAETVLGHQMPVHLDHVNAGHIVR